MVARLAIVVAALVLLAGCSEGADPADPPSPSETSGESSTTGSTGTGDPPPSDPPGDPALPFDTDAVLSDIRHLSLDIGPREATSPAFREATAFVAARLRDLGYDVRRTRVPVPAGDSWGVPVDAGPSYNVIAEPPDLDPGSPYRIVGAHLDSVAVSPGAEDNGSGVSVLLELARLASERPPEARVRFIAFGAEEPRGDGDDLHHFGSRQYVRGLSAAERRTLDAMVALDRVGVYAQEVPICRGGPEGTTLRRDLLRTARAAGVSAAPCDDQASDHWSFEKAGLPAARIGSVPYAGYHSAADLPDMVDRRELHRVGRIMSAWLLAR